MRTIDHYENFPVASVLCPPHLRPPIVAIYHFARTADDIADEGEASADERLQRLAALQTDLLNVVQQSGPVGPTWRPMLHALWLQIERFAIPTEHLLALLSAFEQDVCYTRDQTRYPNREALLDYCNRSANPIGRMLLHLYNIHDPLALRQSDAVCTALQLINFWQDLSTDLPRGRHYLPLNATLNEELVFARSLMLQGAELVHRVPGRAGWELRLVVQGGLRILDKLNHCDAHIRRPRLNAIDFPLLLWRCARMRAPALPKF